MANIYENLNDVRIKRGYSYAQLSMLTGISKSALQRYLTGSIGRVPYDMTVAISNALMVPIESVGMTIPVLKKASAGSDSHDNISGRIIVPHDMAECHFAYRVTGSDMEPRMRDGDIVIIRRTSKVKNGTAALVRVGDGELCRRVDMEGGGIVLTANNSAVQTLFYSAEEIGTLPVVILGEIVELRTQSVL